MKDLFEFDRRAPRATTLSLGLRLSLSFNAG
jgi:hypothetical protein